MTALALHQKPALKTAESLRPAGVPAATWAADALQLMGDAAAACAAKHADAQVVLVKADNIEFHRLANLSERRAVNAHVVFCGRSSMTVLVEISAVDANGADAGAIASGRFMLLAVDENGQPIPIAQTDLTNIKDVNS